MAQTQKVGKTATTISTGADGVTRVTYHSTDVVSFDEHFILLDTGGWRTYTTKIRMNQAANQFGLDFRIYQSKGDWYLRRLGWNTAHDLLITGKRVLIWRDTMGAVNDSDFQTDLAKEALKFPKPPFPI